MAKRRGRYAKFKHMHIDCDPLVYKIGFRCETALYKVDGAEFKTMTDALEYCSGMGVDKEGIVKEITPAPWSEVKEELEKTIRKLRNLFTPSKVYLYLSPSKYFRHCLTDDYKGNRKQSHKPYHYERIRKWFVSKGAKIVAGMEADDVVAINHYFFWSRQGVNRQRVSVIVGEDKDFDNVPGWHYNNVKDKLYYVGASNAICNFYRQLISGDTADNIKGIPGKGAKAAEKLIPDKGWDEVKFWGIVREAYLEYADKKGISEEEIIDYLLLNAHLLWIMWEKEVWFEPPNEEDAERNLKFLQKIEDIFKTEFH